MSIKENLLFVGVDSPQLINCCRTNGTNDPDSTTTKINHLQCEII